MSADRLHGAARLLAESGHVAAPSELQVGDIVADRFRGPYRITLVKPLDDGRFMIAGRHVDQGVPGTPWEHARGWAVLNRLHFDGAHWWDDDTRALLVVVATSPRPVPATQPAPAIVVPAAPPDRAGAAAAQLSLFGGL